MAHESGRAAGSIEPGTPFTALLAQAAERFDFYQALRRLESAYRTHARVGEGLRPMQEPVRLSQEPSLAFAPSLLAAYEPGAAAPPRPARLTVRLLGLFGPHGPLPLHLTEYAHERLLHRGDAALARFADVFHHRMMALLYRAFANTQPTFMFDRPDNDRFAFYVGALCGRAGAGLEGDQRWPSRAKRYYAGALAGKNRHADGLRSIVADYFQTNAQVCSFVGEWAALPQADRWRLTSKPAGIPLTSSVTARTALGRRVWLRQGKFQIVIGPLNREQFADMLPVGRGFRVLQDLVRTYVGEELTWNLRLRLKKSAWRPLRLGRTCRLGWESWLAGRDSCNVERELVLETAQRRR